MRARVLAAMLFMAALTPGAAIAGECDQFPLYQLRPRLTCAGIGEGVCKVGETVRFEPFRPEDPTAPIPSCISIFWTFQRSGAVSFFDHANTKGSESFTRTFDGGDYAVYLSAEGSSVTRGEEFRVARGWLKVTGPSTVNEGAVATFTFTRTHADLSTVIDWKSYRTIEYWGVPPPPSDLVPVEGTITMNAGELTKQLSVAMPPNNATWEPSRHYAIGIVSATNHYLPSGGSQLFTLIDDDVGYLEMDPTVTVREDAGSVSITARRTGNTAPAWTIYYSTTAPVGPVPSGQATIFFDANVPSRSFTVPILDDHVWSGDSTGLVSAVNDGEAGAVRIRNGTTAVRVQEDDPLPTLSVAGGSSAGEGNSGSQSGAFTVKLSAPVKGVDYDYELVDGSATFGSDYTGTKSGVLHFDATHSELTVPFQIIGDTAAEGDESLRLHLSLVSSHASQIAIPPDATFTIVNDDAGLTPLSAQLARGESMRYTLDLGLPAASAITIPLTASDPAILSLPASAQIAAGQTRTTFNVTAREPGTARISARLPGGPSLTSFVTVHDSGPGKPSTPAITSIEPGTGSAAGGTPFIARGLLLTADCTLLFGGADAKTITLTSDGMLSGITPMHATGPVDVTLQCGDDTFVLTNGFTYTAPSRVRSARH